MVTQGLIKELGHISNFFKTPVKCDLRYLDRNIEIEVSSEVVKLSYKDQVIWEESINEHVGNFAIESVQHIFYIIERIDNGEPYENLIYRENCLEINKFTKTQQIKSREEVLDFVRKIEQDAILNNDIKNKNSKP